MCMDIFARTLILIGAAVVIAGMLLWIGARLGLGRLPGDILIERDNVRIAVPIVTSILLSIILTLILNVAIRIWR